MEDRVTTRGGTGSKRTPDVGAETAEGGNAPPSKTRVGKSYQKLKGCATNKGQYFEIKLIALLFLRLKNSGEISEFHLASNVEKAGAIDDIVVKYRTKVNPDKWTICFIQLKHKEKGFLDDDSFIKTKDFSLKKYLKSYIDIKEKIASPEEFLFEGPIAECVIVIYTNSNLRKDLLTRKRERTYHEKEIDTFLKSGSDEQVTFKISEDCDGVLFDFLTSDENTVSDVQGFLDALRVFSGQASEEQLDKIIMSELMKAIGKHQTDVNILYRFFLEAVETWWGKGQETLAQDSGLVTDTLELLNIYSLSLERRKKFQVDLSFLNDHYFSIDCLSNDYRVHVVSPQSCTKLSCTKLVQSLANDYQYMLWSLDDLLQDTEAVMSAWSSRPDSRLIIVSESKAKHEDVCKKLQQGKGQKIIVVSAPDDAFTLNLKESLGGPWTEVPDTFQLAQLEQESKERINNKAVLFQGQRITLGELLDGGGDLVPGVLNDDFVQDILKDKDLTIGPALDTTVPYYIPRTVVSCDVLSLDVLKERDGVFIVDGISAHELQRLVPNGETVGVVGQLEDVNNCRFMVLGSGSDRDTSHMRHKNVHNLKMSPDGSLRWIQSTSNIDIIKKYLVTMESTQSHPNTVMDFKGRITLLEASPGMGKTTICSYLATETKRAHPLTWVLRVNLSSHMDLLNSKEWDNGTQFLGSALGIDKQSPTERALFRHSMEKQGNVVALIDGCDEVAPDYTEQCLTLLESLRKTKVGRVVVTTRHSMRLQIETRLSTLAFSLLSFTKDDQKEFFLQFCNKSGDSVKGPGVNQDQMVNTFLKNLEDSLTASEKGFLGIPLHAMMLAEIYEDDLQGIKNQIPDKLDLLYIFEAVIDKKFRIYFGKKFPDAKNADIIIKQCHKAFNDDHMYAALVLLLDTAQIQSFGDHLATEIVEKNKEFSISIRDSSNDTGIVTKIVDNKAIFLHRTFAEYFAALLFFYEPYEYGNIPFNPL